MIRIFLIVPLVALILIQPVSQFSWEMYYLLNQSYIAEELCENKEEPELACNGKCFLMEQLKKAETANQNAPIEKEEPSRFVAKTAPFISHDRVQIIREVTVTASDKTKSNPPCTRFSIKHLPPIFHPPQA